MDYAKYREGRINSRIIRHSLIKELVADLSTKYSVKLLGKSVKGREIYSVTMGEGERVLLLWSQMHGNEPTATGALFDLINYLDFNKNSQEVSSILKNFRIVFIPMLNPDGAENWTRVNEMNIDLNRDAVKRVSPESKIIWSEIEKLQPEYCFNLHDQRNIFNVGDTDKTATISFLSASFNMQREVNTDRELSMSLIAYMNDEIQKEIPGCVGRYTDEFYPTAMGDNLHKLGYKNILIESGTYPKDPERQITRKMNVVALSKALSEINKGFTNRVDDYNSIPNNSKQLYDLVIRNVLIKSESTESLVDLALMYNESADFGKNKMVKNTRIENIGDLSQYFGIEEFDAENALYCDKNGNFPLLNSVLDFKIGETEVSNGEIKKR